MPEKALDFRSDTVTRPTAGMRAAMASAEVGDDVIGDDPTVHRLQARVAELLGKEAALFVPSGTMANLIATRLHCRPGEEMICEADCHTYYYEQSGYAQINHIAARPVRGDSGVMRLEQLTDLLRPGDPQLARTRLVTIENTHNRGGGRIQPFETVEAICLWARRNGLRLHLDGARLLNAVVATGIAAPQWTRHFDTVMICFSKGLGAPVGSALAGPRELMAEALRYRTVLGGGMRQSGVLAAAALYALDHHVDRLAEDHANAKRLAAGIHRIDQLTLCPDVIDTNMVFFRVSADWGTAAEFAAAMQARGLLTFATSADIIRLVTHLDVTAADVDQAIEILKSLSACFRSNGR
jgi:threonine aldolase